MVDVIKIDKYESYITSKFIIIIPYARIPKVFIYWSIHGACLKIHLSFFLAI